MQCSTKHGRSDIFYSFEIDDHELYCVINENLKFLLTISCQKKSVWVCFFFFLIEKCEKRIFLNGLTHFKICLNKNIEILVIIKGKKYFVLKS